MRKRKLKATISFLLLSFFTLFSVSACEEVVFEPSVQPVDWGTVLAASEFEFEPEIDPRASQVQEAIDAEDYQRAIELAIELYDIDISNVSGVPQYSDDEEMGAQAYGETDPSGGSIYIYQAAFSSPGMLATTIGHEVVHANQLAEGHLYIDVDESGETFIIDIQGVILNEVEAWTWERENAEENGLSDEEIAEIEYMIGYYYLFLDDENRDLADAGIYVLPTPESESP